MLKVLSSILCDLDPKVKVVGQKAGICDGVPSTSALVLKLKCDLKHLVTYDFCDYLKTEKILQHLPPELGL